MYTALVLGSGLLLIGFAMSCQRRRRFGNGDS